MLRLAINFFVLTIVADNFLVHCSNMSEKILYFAFGSNLLGSRMSVNNPTATRAGIGKIKDYKVDFASFSKIWQGYAATIIPSPGNHVWGALWEIPAEDIDKLDRQEGVQVNLYRPITVEVHTPKGEVVNARCYRQVQEVDQVSLDKRPAERRPTPAYIDCMVKGAVESNLPSEYIESLKKIPHSGSTVQPDLAYLYPKE